MTETVRNATHLRRLVANHDVRLGFEVDGADFSVSINTAEAEWLRCQAASAGRDLRASVHTRGVYEFLHLSVQPRSGPWG